MRKIDAHLPDHGCGTIIIDELRDRLHAHDPRDIDEAAHRGLVSGSVPRFWMNCPSILMTSTGKRFRYPNDEAPAPKSSSATLTPSSLARRMKSRASVRFVNRGRFGDFEAQEPAQSRPCLHQQVDGLAMKCPVADRLT